MLERPQLRVAPTPRAQPPLPLPSTPDDSLPIDLDASPPLALRRRYLLVAELRHVQNLHKENLRKLRRAVTINAWMAAVSAALFLILLVVTAFLIKCHE